MSDSQATPDRVDPYLDDGDLCLYHGDALTILQSLPAGIAQTCITSPPYWGLRDYDTGTWRGGDTECDHLASNYDRGVLTDASGRTDGGGASAAAADKRRTPYRDACGKCGARRVDDQLGLEATPDQYVERMVEVFREVRRILRDDGTLWINLGSSYVANPSGGMQGSTLSKGGKQTASSRAGYAARRGARLRDTPCTEPQDSRDPGSTYLDLCDGCAAGLLRRNFHTGLTMLESEPLLGLKGPDTARLDSESGERGLDAPVSTTPGSFLQPQGSCWRCEIRPASVVLPVPLTSWPGAPASAHTESSNPGTDSPESASHNQDTDASGTAWVNYTRTLKQKDMVPIPWMVAMALQADGWYLRSDIIWSKPNPMPESVTDRPTKAHEYVFLFSKQPRYFYDADAVREPNRPDVAGRNRGNGKAYDHRTTVDSGWSERYEPDPAGRNLRSVWQIATEPFPEAHFATYPQELVRRCIKAGTSERGECGVCGAPWRRVVERGERIVNGHTASDDPSKYQGDAAYGEDYGATAIRTMKPGMAYENKTTGWEPSCSCDAPTRPQLCIDPFVGSGTTALVARKHGRRSLGIDLSSEYLRIAARRTQQLSLLGGVG